MKPTLKSITCVVLSILGLYFFFRGMIEAKTFLAPLLVSGLLAMMLLPLCRVLEKIMPRGVASFLSVLVYTAFNNVTYMLQILN